MLSILSSSVRLRVALAALVLTGQGLSAQVPRYAIANWNTEDGLPSNVTLKVRQTSDGYLWLASYEGLVRFDGVSFRNFSEIDVPGLRRPSFWRIAADSLGGLWAASETSGLIHFADWRWRLYRTADGLKSDKVTAVYVDGPVVWVGTREGVNRVVGGEVQRIPAPRGMPEPFVIDMARDGDGYLWIATAAEGLLRYRDGVYTRVDTASGLNDNRGIVVYRDRDGAVWVGTYGSGLSRIHHGRLTHHALTGPNVPRRVNDVLRTPDGILWIAADNGLFHLVNDQAVPVLMPDGLPIIQASGLYADADGNVWVGARQGGLFRLRPSRVAPLTTADGLPHPLVSVVEGDGADGAWIGGQGGVAHWTPRGVERVLSHAGGELGDDIVRDLLRARDGTVWMATNGGLTRLSGGRTTLLTRRDGLPDDRVRALAEDAHGLWIGTYRGLAYLRDGRIRTFGAADGLADLFVLSVFVDRRGQVWVGTQSEGLFRLQGGRFVQYPVELAGQPIFRISESRDGTLWVGTGQGIARIRGGRTAMFGTRQGLPSNAVFQALEDARGDIWATGPWGIAQIHRRGLDSVPSGRNSLTLKVFGSSDGMLAREASSISRAWRAPDGVLWFATPAGVARINPAQPRRRLSAPLTHLERVVVDGEVFERTTSVVVPPGARRLEFHYTAPDFVAPEQLRFRYRLDGFDPAWLDGGTRRAAYYTNVPPGRYVFRVQARNADGVWSSALGGVRVELRPYFWQTTWFYLLIGVLLAATAYLAYRLRLRSVQRAVREELLRDLSLHDDLTGLYNRRGLLALAEQLTREAERQRIGFDVVFADLDGMKRINDTFGHLEGDQALRETARLIRSTFRESDVVARLGGDEFAVLVLNDQSGDGVENAFARLLEAMARHNEATLRPYVLSLSLGYATYDPQAPRSIESLLELADRRMFDQKRAKILAR